MLEELNERPEGLNDEDVSSIRRYYGFESFETESLVEEDIQESTLEDTENVSIVDEFELAQETIQEDPKEDHIESMNEEEEQIIEEETKST